MPRGSQSLVFIRECKFIPNGNCDKPLGLNFTSKNRFVFRLVYDDLKSDFAHGRLWL